MNTVPIDVDEGVVSAAGYGPLEVAEAARTVLSPPPELEPSDHPLLVRSGQSLQALVAAVEATL